MRGTVALAVMATLAACGPQANATPKPSPTPSRSTRVRTTPLPLDQVPPDVAQLWGDVGATIVPPTDFLQHIDLKAEVINHSGGKVDDATARQWAEAFLRQFRWDNWAIQYLQNGALRQLAAPDGFTQQAVLGDDYGFIHRAQDSGGRLDAVAATITRVVVVPVSAPTKATLTGIYSYPAPVPDWALIVSAAGPLTMTLTSPDGKTQKLVDLPPTFREDAFAAGEIKDYPSTLGTIWLLHTYLSCQKNDFLRAACAS
jgi:hypothetical protein